MDHRPKVGHGYESWVIGHGPWAMGHRHRAEGVACSLWPMGNRHRAEGAACSLCHMARGTWLVAHGPSPIACGAWPVAHGPWRMARDPWPVAYETLLDPRHKLYATRHRKWVVGRGPLTIGHGQTRRQTWGLGSGQRCDSSVRESGSSGGNALIKEVIPFLEHLALAFPLLLCLRPDAVGPSIIPNPRVGRYPGTGDEYAVR